jgi:hypothetical protein
MGVAPMKVLNGGSLAAQSAPHVVVIWRRPSLIQGFQYLQALEETA